MTPSDVPTSPSRGWRLPAHLRFAGSERAELTFRGWLPARAPLLLTPLFLTLSSLPWWSGAAPNGTRVAVSLVALGVALGCGAWGWPRRQLLRLDPAAGQLSRKGEILRLGGELHWVLSTLPELDSPRTSYVAEIEGNSGLGVALLVDSDPARLLRQLRELRASFPAPVECRWGLPADTEPWSFEPREIERASPGADEGALAFGSRHAGAGLVTCLVIIAVALIADMALLVGTKGAQVSSIHSLSILLPLVVAAALVAISWGIGGLEERLLIGQRLTACVRAFGRTRAVTSVPAEALRGVYVVGSSDAERGHVLLDSARGPLAISASRYEINGLAARIRQALSTSQAGLGVIRG